MVRFDSLKDVRRLTLSELRSKNLKLLDNIIFKLPVTFLLKWLAIDRLGSFYVYENRLHFQEGLHRMDIYQPIPGKFKPFEIAACFQELQKSTHLFAIEKLMNFRSTYLSLSDTAQNLRFDDEMYYENENEILDVNTRIRFSRKRNRKSK